MADTTVSVILRGVDRLSGPFKRARSELGILRSEFGRMGSVGARWGKFKHEFAESGALPKATKAWGNLGKEVGSAVGKLALVGGAMGFVFKDFIDTAAQFEMFRAELEALEGSSEGASKAMAWIEDFAVKTPTDVAGVIEAFKRLKAFGLDPTDGTLQSVTDATAKLGFSQDKLMRVSLALGQAWGKQKLQGQEIMQLIEAGVPVWSLLEKATGKTQQQLAKMSEKGELTRDVIAKLIDEMGRDAAGASEKQMRTWVGLVSNLGDAWTKFKRMVMEAGVFDALKGQLDGLLARVEAMTKSGELKIWAQKVGAGMLDVARAIPPIVTGIASLVVFFAKLVDAIGGPAVALKLFAGFQAAKVVLAMANMGGAAFGLGKALLGLLPTLLAGGQAAIAFGIALFANPIGLVILAVVALGAAVAALIIYWDDIVAALKRAWEWLSKVGDLMKMSGPSSAWINRKSDTALLGGAVGAPPAPAPPTAGTATVEGQIGVHIDSEGRPSVRELMSKGGVNMSVTSGLAMRGGL